MNGEKKVKEKKKITILYQKMSIKKFNGKLKAKIILNKIYLKTGIDVLKYILEIKYN